MIIRYADQRDDDDQQGKILLFIKEHFSPDAEVDIEELVELRCEIDRFLFLDRSGMIRR